MINIYNQFTSDLFLNESQYNRKLWIPILWLQYDIKIAESRQAGKE